MKRSSTETHKIANSKALHTVVFVIALISFTLNDSSARAASVMPSDYRLAAAADKFDHTRQFATAFKMRPQRRLRARRLEPVMGAWSVALCKKVCLSSTGSRAKNQALIHDLSTWSHKGNTRKRGPEYRVAIWPPFTEKWSSCNWEKRR